MEYHFTINVTTESQPIIDSLQCLGEGDGGAAFEDCFESLGEEALEKAADMVEGWQDELTSGEDYSEEGDVHSIDLHGGGEGETFAEELQEFYESFGCQVTIEGEWV